MQLQLILVLIMGQLIIGISYYHGLAWARVSRDSTLSARNSRELSQSEIPKLLFHWTSGASLRRLALQNSHSAGVLPLKRISNDFIIAKIYPILSDKPGLFTWHHPATGLGANIAEPYAKLDSKSGEPPRVVMLKINPEAKGLLLISRTYSREQDGGRYDLLDYDIVLHMVLDEPNNILLREWLVLNAKAVTEFSADPVGVSKILREYIGIMKKKRGKVADADIHVATSDYNYTNISINYLEAILNAWQQMPKGNEVPAFFRRPMYLGDIVVSVSPRNEGGGSIINGLSCNWLFRE